MKELRYRIKEVSDLIHVPVSTLRYWQKEFGQFVKPQRTKGGQRRYFQCDVAFFKKLKVLLYEEGKSIADVRQILFQGSDQLETINWANQTVLITGGTGFVGRYFCQTLLEQFNVKSVRIFSRGAVEQEKMRIALDDSRIRFFIGDVRDRGRLIRAMAGVDFVVHAAALKQSAICDHNPFEAVKTNVIGTQNIIEAAMDTGVKKVVALSEDKVVIPCDLYSATKVCSEKMMVQGNVCSPENGPKFSVVRCSSLMGSGGNIISYLLAQKRNRKISIIDKRMTRFWMTLEKLGLSLINAFNIMQGGEIFVPQTSSMKVLDLVASLAPECEIEFAAEGSFEKIHEMLISEEDGRRTLEYGDMYIILPRHCNGKRKALDGSCSVKSGFSYSSDACERWLSGEQLNETLFGHPYKKALIDSGIEA